MSILKKTFWIPFLVGGIVLCFQNCGSKSMESALGQEYLSSLDEPPPVINLSCHFDGVDLMDGQTVTAYQNSTVPGGSSCIYEKRHCEAGNLTGSYNYSSCEIAVPASCLFNGQTVLSGNTVRAYVNASPAMGAACVEEVRTCIDGKLLGSYGFSTCKPTPCAGCNLNGRNLAHNESIKAYLNSTTAAGVTCKEEMRKCNNGTLTGSYAFSACTPGMFRSCTFNGKVVAHGESLDAYLKSAVAASATCASEKRVCNDGMLSGSYSFASCSKDAFRMCSFNGANLAHGQSIRAYAASTVPFGKTCTPTIRDCFDGTLSGSGSFATCNVNAPAMCNFNGTNIAHGQTFKAYTVSHVPPHKRCSSVSVMRSCDNGTLTGSASGTFSTCVVDED